MMTKSKNDGVLRPKNVGLQIKPLKKETVGLPMRYCG